MMTTFLSSVGVIGGADGPTAVFVTSQGPGIVEIVIVIALVATIEIFVRKRRNKK